jgi:hypothetical protein
MAIASALALTLAATASVPSVPSISSAVSVSMYDDTPNAFVDFTVAENIQGYAVEFGLELLGTLFLPAGRQPNSQCTVCLYPMVLNSANACDSPPEYTTDFIRAGMDSLYTSLNASTLDMNTSSAAAAQALIDVALLQSMQVMAPILHNFSTANNFFGSKMEYTLECFNGSSDGSSVLLMKTEAIAFMYAVNTTLSYDAAVATLSTIGDKAAGATASCTLNTDATSGTVPTCSASPMTNSSSSLQAMQPAILEAAEGCLTLRLCAKGESSAAVHLAQCSFGVDFEVQMQTTFMEDWVCVYL